MECYTKEQLPNVFSNGANIGLLLGKPSGGLVDIDLDWPEARRLAGYLLPKTEMIGGRASAPNSHYWYVCNPLVKTGKFLDPSVSGDDRAMIVELRSTGGQTVVPPSLHPSGEVYEWYGRLQPALVSGNDLAIAVRKLAACALVVRHWQRGQRHHTALALAGTLLRAGWERWRAEAFIKLAATIANDEEIDDRVRAVETTEDRIKSGTQATGLPSLAELLGDKVVSCLQKWLALTSGPSVTFGSSSDQSNEPSVKVVCMADIKAEQVKWLWYPRIPLGKLTLIEGDPGLGKSWLTCAMATAIADGNGLPGTEQTEPQNVLILSAEDGLADTIRPRLDSMNADVSRIFALDGAIVFDDAGLLQVEAAITSHSPAAVFVDPMVAYLGAGVDLHRANETRAVMKQLARIAEKHGCAIIGVRHLTKGGASRAIYRGLGSIDITAACRSVLLVGSDPDDPDERAVVHIKSNLAPIGESVGYTLTEGLFFWTGKSNLTAERILAASSGSDEATALSEAENFLKEVLAEGPIYSKEVQKQADEAGISERTLWRAKRSLGVEANKQGASWYWRLPDSENCQNSAKSAKEEDVWQTSQVDTDKGLNTQQDGKAAKSANPYETWQPSDDWGEL